MKNINVLIILLLLSQSVLAGQNSRTQLPLEFADEDTIPREKAPTPARPAQCLHLAKKTAQAIDGAAKTDFAYRNPIEKSEVVYEDAGMQFAKYLTYNFGTGESFLEVVIRADAYHVGDCIFRSATVISQE